MFYQVGITSDFARRSLLILLNLGFCITNIEFLHQFYRYFLYIIIVTDKKIHRIKKTLLCTNDHQSIDLWMIQDIDRSQHGLLQNLLKFGSMRLEAQETVVRLHFIPRVAKKYEELLRLKEMARNASRRLPSADRKRREEMMMQQAKESLLDSTRMQGSEVY